MGSGAVSRHAGRSAHDLVTFVPLLLSIFAGASYIGLPFTSSE
jgi:hypothetical protein